MFGTADTKWSEIIIIVDYVPLCKLLLTSGKFVFRAESDEYNHTSQNNNFERGTQFIVHVEAI